MQRTDYLVSFDTPSDRRRRKLTRLLMPYGVRVQKSVFRISLTRQEFGGLWLRLQAVCLPEEDALLASEIRPNGWHSFGPTPQMEVPLIVNF